MVLSTRMDTAGDVDPRAFRDLDRTAFQLSRPVLQLDNPPVNYMV